MQKILRKRVLRDLKKNALRYVALGAMIIIGMYLIVSLVGAADTVITQVDKKAMENHLEDGEFSVFVPLTKEQMKPLLEKGVRIEAMNYLDYIVKAQSTLRLYQTREQVNTIALEEGTLPQQLGEGVLEKRYAKEHHLAVGDTIEIGGKSITIVGIGTVPDYDAMYKSFADTSVNSEQFGLLFVTKEQYTVMNGEGFSNKAEEYVYAYQLKGSMTEEELKEYLKDLALDKENVKDPYFQEYWDQTIGKKEQLQEGIGELFDGSSSLQNGLSQLKDQNKTVQDGAKQTWEAYLLEANEGLESSGYQTKLTEENFDQVLSEWIDASDNGLVVLKLESIRKQLRDLKAYKDGMVSYTNGVSDAKEGAESLTDGLKELKTQTDSLLDTYFSNETSNLTQFVKAEDNPRIKASAADQVINKFAGLLAGVIIMILFTYVISVFVIHGIERERGVIGALYALGAKKKDLMVHYLMLPVLVTLLAGTIGTILGFSKLGVDYQMLDCYDYFSVPKLTVIYPVYLIIYGVVMPPAISILVNCIVIQKKLSCPALQLMRGEQKGGNISRLKLSNMGFISRFRICQMCREARTSFTVIFGLLISLLIMMLGIDCYYMCHHMSVDNKADTRFEYMYMYKYPDEMVPQGGEAAMVKTLSKEIYGYDLDISLLGIRNENPYFQTNVETGQNKVSISSAMAQKFHLKIGDTIVLSDQEEDRDYAFTVTDLVEYSVGLYAFMDINSMRSLFGQEDTYYNVVF